MNHHVRIDMKQMLYMTLTSSLKGNLAWLTGSQDDNAFDPGACGKLGVWSQVTVNQAETWI